MTKNKKLVPLGLQFRDMRRRVTPKIKIVTILLLLLSVAQLALAASQLPSSARDSVYAVLRRMTLREVAGGYTTINSIRVRGGRTIEVRASKELAYYPFREESVAQFYDSVRMALPESYRRHTLRIYADGELIDNLVPQYYASKVRDARFTNPSARPLTRRKSALSQPDRGLAGRHIALWQSHGRYYDAEKGVWKWQRSRLWETVEDLYTQSYVLPYILPMLESAGATVLLPRERSLQRAELIADNDSESIGELYYREIAERPYRWKSEAGGFAQLLDVYPSGHNPFTDGTVRYVATTDELGGTATATWGGEIAKSGLYTLYVSYKSLRRSVRDARYRVYASGGVHEIEVNQRMGGSMWVPLGEFYFEAGEYDRLVTLDNYSTEEGVVVADAVKIGGGMGNVERGGETSGYPRYTEGARYWLQWSGFGEEVYAPKGGTDDYKEDYMSRPHWINALMGGSQRLGGEAGRSIPLDMALAFHSDAGVRLNDDVIGTLGIYCTKENKGRFEDNISRMRSRDLTDVIMTQIVDDIRALHEPNWTRRGMWDRGYYEARMGGCPTMLLELLSHQNFADMRYGLDPSFRFDVSRAVYKGVLRFLASQYGVEYVVQPLPVNSFSAELTEGGVRLSWQPTEDRLESTATPDYYILYTRTEGGGFDTGMRVEGTSVEVALPDDTLCSYRLTAVNRGGESFPSETLSACRVTEAKGRVLVVNGFDRVAAPLSIQGDSIAGFYNRYDSGVGYIRDIAFIGEQTNFDRRLSRSENDSYALGQSYSDYEGEIIAGNTFDYPAMHGRSIVRAGYSFCSSSRRAVEQGRVSLEGYDVVDVVMGKQRTTAIGRGAMGYRYEVFGEALERVLADYSSAGGALLLSGSYMFDDLWHSPLSDESSRRFARDVLHAEFGGSMATRRGAVESVAKSYGRRERLSFNQQLSSEIYCVESPEVVAPSKDAVTILRYAGSGSSAAVAYRAKEGATGGGVVVVGFPFETIGDEEQRDGCMSQIINILTTPIE